MPGHKKDGFGVTGLGSAAHRLNRLRCLVGRIGAKLRWEARRASDRFWRVLGACIRTYQGAWMFVDRADEANDNAEHLFHYVREYRPNVDACFVLKKGEADWYRMVRQGHRQRLVPHGSFRWRLLVASSAVQVSSHPISRQGWANPGAKFVNLRHGVSQADQSRWLNQFDVDLVIASTQAEYSSLTEDGGPYRLRPSQVRLTGMPRFDRLRTLSLENGRAGSELILVFPTWRKWLCLSQEPGRRSLVGDYAESQFVERWSQFLRSEELFDHANATGKRIAFLLHPLMQPALEAFQVPVHVERLQFAGKDVQSLLARASVLVTDYSSIAFDAAYIDCPVVYYQFDRELVLDERRHTWRPGYFDYRRDGFGPVLETHEEAVHAVIHLATGGFRLEDPYRQRANSTFPQRDGRCCERVTLAIEDLLVTARRKEECGRNRGVAWV